MIGAPQFTGTRRLAAGLATVLTALLVLPPPPGSAHPRHGLYSFDRISIEQGLSQSTVQAILQDRDGFLWFGTKDGLNRYDGYGFVVFRPDPARREETIAGDDVRLLHEDSRGWIWVATAGGGLSRYDKSTGLFTTFEYDPANPDALSGGEITVMFEDSRKSFWVGTTMGLNRYNPVTNSFTCYRYIDGKGRPESGSAVNAIHEDASGSVWFGTDAGLKKYDSDKGTFRAYEAPGSNLGAQRITALGSSGPGSIWVGTENGLYIVNQRAGSVRRHTATETGVARLSGNHVTFIRPEGTGGVWIGTTGGLDRYEPAINGFIRYGNAAASGGGAGSPGFIDLLTDAAGATWLISTDRTLHSHDRATGQFVSFGGPGAGIHQLTYKRVNCFYEDRSGSVWFGTAGGGLSKLSRGKWKFGFLGSRMEGASALRNHSVTAIAEAPDGSIWIGTAEDGLARFDPASAKLSWYLQKNAGSSGRLHDHVTAIEASRRGEVWVGMDDGALHRFIPAAGKLSRIPPSAGAAGGEGMEINVLRFDRRGNLWVGSGSGIERLEGANARIPVDLGEMLGREGERFSVTALHEDSAGTLWLGTDAGDLIRFDPAAMTAAAHSVCGDASVGRHSTVTAIIADRPGRIWVGTSGSGLYRFDVAEMSFCPAPGRGLLENRIHGMLAEEGGALWISTNSGITRYDPVEIAAREYDVSDGLQSNEFNRGAYCLLASGEMLFGGVGGVNRFHPAEIADNTSVPSLVLSSFRIFDREVPVAVRDGRTPRIELSHRENFFTFEFASTDYAAPERNRYAYQMVGFDEGWIYSGSRRIASYTNLDPGLYTFRFKGSNSDGVWNEDGASIIISIRPPFWRTSWFQLIAAFVLLGGIYAGYRYKVRSIHTQKANLEGLVEERTRDLWDITRELRAARDQLELRVSERTLELRNANESLRQEIVDRIETQDELRKLKEFHENLIHTMTEGVVVVGLDGKLSYVNPAAAGLLGYVPEDLTGKHWSMIVPSGSRELVSAADERRRQGVSDHYELQMLRKDGTRVEVFVGGSPIYTDDRLTGTIAVFTDITGLKSAESRIKEQAALIDKARDVIIVTDVGGIITYWNASAEEIYRWSAEEAVGRNVRELLQDRPGESSTDAARIILERGEWSGELHHLTRDGRTVIMQSRWTLVKDADGSPKSIMMINTDVTEKVKLEMQFLRAQRMESLGTLASGIAHDLNNVLAPIIMALQILRNKMTDYREKTLLTTMELSAKRGSDIVKQVLMFARGAEGRHEELQLKHVVREMETIVRETFPRSIECRTDVPKDLLPVSGDPTQLHQVLLNLCVNARDAMMPKGGILRITAENVELDNYELQLEPGKRSGPYVVVSVSDSGCGMSKDTMMKIFEPFFTTKGVGKGTGLGLSTVNGIIRGHGGFITVYSEPGAGSTFRLYLPAAGQGASGVRKDDAPSLPAGKGETILLVDDEPAIRQIAKGTLETYGYRVLTAADGVEAEEIYREHLGEVVLVITDMMMPVRDGRETIRVLRSITPGLKIVVTSGLIGTEAENGGLSRGTEAFIAKPFTAEKLLTTLRDVLHVQRN